MIGTKLYWIDGPWPGKLAIAARPRGGDWVEDEIAAWRNAGVDVIGSLLTESEDLDLELVDEESAAKAHHLSFFRFPIPDRGVPASETQFSRFLAKLDAELAKGRNVVVHCRQGIGRSGMAAAGLLVGKGVEPSQALEVISAARGISVPETLEQRRWMDRYATTAVAQHE